MIDNTGKYYVNANKITNEQEADLTGIVGNDIFQYMYMLWISYTYIYHTNSCKNNAHICTGLLLIW